VENAEQILALGLLAAAQALDFREAQRMAPATRAVYTKIRAAIPHLAADRVMQGDIQRALALIKEGLG
jgi:histidine ammonia-lyase